jgi:hypothetical protein
MSARRGGVKRGRVRQGPGRRVSRRSAGRDERGAGRRARAPDGAPEPRPGWLALPSGSRRGGTGRAGQGPGVAACVQARGRARCAGPRARAGGPPRGGHRQGRSAGHVRAVLGMNRGRIRRGPGRRVSRRSAGRDERGAGCRAPDAGRRAGTPPGMACPALRPAARGDGGRGTGAGVAARGRARRAGPRARAGGPPRGGHRQGRSAGHVRAVLGMNRGRIRRGPGRRVSRRSAGRDERGAGRRAPGAGRRAGTPPGMSCPSEGPAARGDGARGTGARGGGARPGAPCPASGAGGRGTGVRADLVADGRRVSRAGVGRVHRRGETLTCGSHISQAGSGGAG